MWFRVRGRHNPPQVLNRAGRSGHLVEQKGGPNDIEDLQAQQETPADGDEQGRGPSPEMKRSRQQRRAKPDRSGFCGAPAKTDHQNEKREDRKRREEPGHSL